MNESTVARVALDDPFWGRFRETVTREGIPYQWKALNDQLDADAEPSRCMRNFRIAAGKEQGEFGGFVFQDSDVYKWLEGVAYSLRWKPDPALEAVADGAIEEITAAQQPDGYLDTYYIINGLDRRWTNLKDHHELYVAGHMIEAAVAYYRVTGKRALLDAAIRFVKHIDSVIGPEEGKLRGYPGHPVAEMALMRLYEVTGDPMHLKLAEYFVNERGKSPLFFEEEDARNGNGFYWKNSPFRYQYYQAGRPVRDQKDARATRCGRCTCTPAWPTWPGSPATQAWPAPAGPCGRAPCDAGCMSPARWAPRSTARPSPSTTTCPTTPCTARPAPPSGWCSSPGACCSWSRGPNTPT